MGCDCGTGANAKEPAPGPSEANPSLLEEGLTTPQTGLAAIVTSWDTTGATSSRMQGIESSRGDGAGCRCGRAGVEKDQPKGEGRVCLIIHLPSIMPIDD